MPYNLHGPALTLTADERAAEAKRLLQIIAREDEDTLERKLTREAKTFLREKFVAMSFGGVGVAVTEKELLWLRDLKSKFD